MQARTFSVRWFFFLLVVVEEWGSEEMTNQLLGAAFEANKRQCRRALPWEIGPVAQVFGGARGPLGSLRGGCYARPLGPWLGQDWRTTACPPTPPLVNAVEASGRSLFDRDPGLPPSQEDERERKIVMETWVAVVKGLGAECELYRSAKGDDELAVSVGDVLSTRATATLRSRGYAVRANML